MAVTEMNYMEMAGEKWASTTFVNKPAGATQTATFSNLLGTPKKLILTSARVASTNFGIVFIYLNFDHATGEMLVDKVDVRGKGATGTEYNWTQSPDIFQINGNSVTVAEGTSGECWYILTYSY